MKLRPGERAVTGVKNKGQTIIMICVAVIFVVSAAVCAFMLLSEKGSVVEIVSGGKVLYTLDLSKEPDREITVEYKGRKNIIAIKDHEIYVKEADCPNHNCIKMGRLGKSGVPIVCLPNQLIIRYKSGNGGDVDAAV